MATIHVETYTPTDPRLGRHVEHDERSYSYMLLPKETKPKGISTFWRSSIRPLDQGSTGSCTGMALAQWLNTDYAAPIRAKTHAGKPLTEADALHVYSMATHIDAIPGAYPPSDTGSTGGAACKAGAKIGYLTRYSWLFSFTSVLAALESGPAMFGTVWTSEMFTPTKGLVKVGKISADTIAGGHEYLGMGVDYDKEVCVFRNSWGDQDAWEGCKPGGYFAVGFDDVRRLLAARGDVTIPVGAV